MINLSSMFEGSKTNIEEYTVVVATNNGLQYWDVEIFLKKYPRISKKLVEKFNGDEVSIDFKKMINVSLQF